MTLRDGEYDRDESVAEAGNDECKRKRKYEFPVKLFSILEDMNKAGRKDVISWLPDGDSFRIHDVETFSKDVLPKYCNGIQYKSFIRNINLYCFQRVREGKSPNVGAYYHPMFKQGQLELCLKITRPKRPRHDGKKKQSQKVLHKDEGIKNECSSSSFQKYSAHFVTRTPSIRSYVLPLLFPGHPTRCQHI